jgi:hypothetical protein
VAAVQYTFTHKQYIEQHNNRTTQKIMEVYCGSCPIFAGFTLAFALQLRKKHGKSSVRVAEECSGTYVFLQSDDCRS